VRPQPGGLDAKGCLAVASFGQLSTNPDPDRRSEQDGRGCQADRDADDASRGELPELEG
jgi:hypothetical protein